MCTSTACFPFYFNFCFLTLHSISIHPYYLSVCVTVSILDNQRGRRSRVAHFYCSWPYLGTWGRLVSLCVLLLFPFLFCSCAVDAKHPDCMFCVWTWEELNTAGSWHNTFIAQMPLWLGQEDICRFLFFIPESLSGMMQRLLSNICHSWLWSRIYYLRGANPIEFPLWWTCWHTAPTEPFE